MRCAAMMAMALLTPFFMACSEANRSGPPAALGEPAGDSQAAAARFREEREGMVRETILARGVTDSRVLAAMRKVPRHLFVPEEVIPYAYEDYPLAIGEGQTISQPYIVAVMTELAGVQPGDTVLEIGTGSGYGAAVLAEVAGQVHTIEIIETLGRAAETRLARLGYRNIHVRVGDGYRGWPEAAPFAAIIVTAAPDHVPQPLIDQLKTGGRLVIPVGAAWQELLVVTRTADGSVTRSTLPVRFVPMTGEAQAR